MLITFHGFGSVRVLSGYTLEVDAMSSIAVIRNQFYNSIIVHPQYAKLTAILATIAFASEQKIYMDDDVLSHDVTINLLPPVCGG